MEQVLVSVAVGTSLGFLQLLISTTTEDLPASDSAGSTSHRYNHYLLYHWRSSISWLLA